MSTVETIAERVGVSVKTVYRVINNDPSVKPDTATEIRRLLEQKSFKPKPVKTRPGKGRRHARRHNRYYQLALLSSIKTSMFETPVYSKLVRGVEDELGKLDYNLIVRNLPHENPEDTIPHKIDGAILLHLPAENKKLLRNLRLIPCVRIMGTPLENDFFDHVTYNNSSIGKMAAEYLLKKGHRRIAIFWSGNYKCQYAVERYETFVSAVKAGGGEVSSFVNDSFVIERENGQIPDVKLIMRAVEELLTSPKKPTAIFATVDMISVGLHYVLPHLNLVPGRDIEIIGCNNDEKYLNPFLESKPVTIDIHPEQVGRKAVERLLWRIGNPKEPLGRIMLEPELAFS